MTSGLTRKMGLAAEEKKEEQDRHATQPGAEGPGVRDWFDELPKAANGRKAATFDTRADARMAGGAAHGIARRLRRHGYRWSASRRGSSSMIPTGRCGQASPSGLGRGVPTSWGNPRVA
jgi:hypothetical protein